MRRLALAFVLAALTQSAALAHRVNVFAFVEGGEVVVECSYSKSKRVNHGSIDVQDLQSGASLLTGETDDSGLFRFAVPEPAKMSGLRIVLNAGEGHQNDWVMDASEFSAAGGKPETGVAATPQPKPIAAPAGVPSPGVTRADVEEIVNAALDAKLAPIRRAMLESAEQGPGVREIVGGIGWILGLVGIGAYFKSRTRV